MSRAAVMDRQRDAVEAAVLGLAAGGRVKTRRDMRRISGLRSYS